MANELETGSCLRNHEKVEWRILSHGTHVAVDECKRDIIVDPYAERKPVKHLHMFELVEIVKDCNAMSIDIDDDGDDDGDDDDDDEDEDEDKGQDDDDFDVDEG